MIFLFKIQKKNNCLILWCICTYNYIYFINDIVYNDFINVLYFVNTCENMRVNKLHALIDIYFRRYEVPS